MLRGPLAGGYPSFLNHRFRGTGGIRNFRMGIFSGVRGARTFLIRVGRLAEIVQDFLFGVGHRAGGVRDYWSLGGGGIERDRGDLKAGVMRRQIGSDAGHPVGSEL